jgi:hypothetical protein
VSGRLNRWALVVGLGLLAVGPLALTLARASDYRSSATITYNPENSAGPLLPRAEALVAGPLDVRDLQRDVARQVGWFDSPEDLADYVHVEQRGGADGPEFVVTARGPAPPEARELAEATAANLRNAAEASAKLTQPLQLQRIGRALRLEGVGDAERAELLDRRSEVARSVRENQEIFAPAPGPATLDSERLGDRILGALPGTRPLRPDPVWAAVAGIALAGALALWVLVLSSPRRPGGTPSRG